MIRTLDSRILFSVLSELESYKKLRDTLGGEKLRKTKVTALAGGVMDSAKCHLACSLAAELGRPVLFVTAGDVKAREIHRDISFFFPETTKFYPAKDLLFYEAEVNDWSITKGRLEVLSALLEPENEVKAVVCSIEAFFGGLSSKEAFIQHIIDIREGDSLDLTEFLRTLVKMGYEYAQTVEGPGQFANRGGIIDLFSPTWRNPVRIELWGDEVDSIRFIDPLTQRSVDKTGHVRCYPARENFYSDEENNATILDYMPPDTIIFIDEPSRAAEMAELNRVTSYPEFLARSEDFSRVLLCAMAVSAHVSGFSVDGLFGFLVKSGLTIQNRPDLLIDDLRYLVQQGYRVLLLAGGEARMERLFNELTEAGFTCAKSSTSHLESSVPNILLSSGTLTNGFEYPQIKFTVITSSDIFGARKPKRARSRKDGTPITDFSDLSPGDYVVHNTHGIGIYRGIEKITSEDVSRDYLKISYADGGNLYVSAAGLDSLQKYIGGEEAKPKLHKLGGQEFARAKARVRSAVAEIAGELMELYAKREAARGHWYQEDTVWQREFEESFPYEETGDQLAAVADIKADMEKGKVMDRLICGDVGYGKTEVAIRAAFKAVIEGKQAAFLAPTTILAQQHYNTLIQRMRDFPVTVDLMSRFRTPANMRETASKLTTGAVDIVVGTHRLLSKDIKFKDLGLIVVDEEQRFGVAHKERLKQLRANVNVITLSATPIPRTLHMSLTGIRDLSMLDEPPLERVPVQTYVMEYNPDAVANAIRRELDRGGQVYYLHNRVKTIHDAAVRLAGLVPEASIGIGHGQMSERELENVMLDFIQGDIDILVCTTIIENGLDIPNVNTIIIQDADYLGLSSLYQLRGRVGRSNRAAYCYLMYRRDKVLTEASEKRLQIIRAFTEFGAGYKIALRDLSMRGAGNVLGAQQHGHMDAVGYEMYLKLLNEAVSKSKGEDVSGDFETLIDIPVDAFIPERYIPNETQKLDAYRCISQITDDVSYLDVQDELLDRFGELPASVVNLLDIALLKATAHKIDAVSVIKKGGRLVVTFMPDAGISPEKLTECIARHRGRLTFAISDNPTLSYLPPDGEAWHIALRRVLLELL